MSRHGRKPAPPLRARRRPRQTRLPKQQPRLTNRKALQRSKPQHARKPVRRDQREGCRGCWRRGVFPLAGFIQFPLLVSSSVLILMSPFAAWCGTFLLFLGGRVSAATDDGVYPFDYTSARGKDAGEG